MTSWRWNWRWWPPLLFTFGGMVKQNGASLSLIFSSFFFLVHESKHLKHRHAVWHWRSLCVPRRVASFYQKRSLVFHVEMLFFPFIPLSWEDLPELIHPSQCMNFQSGISRIFQCGSSFVNLASVAYVAGKGNVNRIWSLGQCGLPHLFQRKTSKKKKKKKNKAA